MNNKIINRYFRTRIAIGYFLSEIAIAFVGWLLLHILCSACGSLVNYSWINWGQFVYILLVLIFIVASNIHSTVWYIAKYPLYINCPKCGTTTPLTRYGEEYVLSEDRALYFEPPSAILIDSKIRFYKITLRPYLQLDCPTCHEQQVICPYCRKGIPQEHVKCTYDKPTECPHCGKKIYTPMRREDNEKLIKITQF